MLTQRAHKIAVYIAFVLLTAWVLWSSLQSFYAPIQIYSETTKDHGAGSHAMQEKEKTDEALARYTRYLAWFTGILAVATIVLGAATIWLGLAGERQFKLARNEFLSTHRPELRLKHIWFASTDGNIPADDIRNRPLVVTLDIVNVGRNNAFVEFVNFATLILWPGDELPQRPPYDNPGAPQNFLAHDRVVPGLTLKVPISDGRILTDREGTIGYRDDLEYLRQTAFCRYFKGPIDSTPISFGPFKRHKHPDYEYQD